MIKTHDRADYHRNLAAVLDGRAELLVKPEEALRVMEVIDLIFDAHERGKFLHCHI